jgi:hypothetical protein
MRGESSVPEERVRQALAELGADAASAPDVPASVTARIGAALRAAPAPPAHTVVPARSSRLRIVALAVGIGAAMVAAAIGVAMLVHSDAAPRFPSGPTAEKITVSTSVKSR